MSLRRDDPERQARRAKKRPPGKWAKRWARTMPDSWLSYKWEGWGAAFSILLVVITTIVALANGATIEWRDR